MQIKILGGGCKNCEVLYDHAKEAVAELGIQVEIIKITDIKEILTYNIMSMPALVIDNEVVSNGKVLKTKEIVKILSNK